MSSETGGAGQDCGDRGRARAEEKKGGRGGAREAEVGGI